MKHFNSNYNSNNQISKRIIYGFFTRFQRLINAGGDLKKNEKLITSVFWKFKLVYPKYYFFAINSYYFSFRIKPYVGDYLFSIICGRNSLESLSVFN